LRNRLALPPARFAAAGLRGLGMVLGALIMLRVVYTLLQRWIATSTLVEFSSWSPYERLPRVLQGLPIPSSLTEQPLVLVPVAFGVVILANTAAREVVRWSRRSSDLGRWSEELGGQWLMSNRLNKYW
jgi:hypothetical protein